MTGVTVFLTYLFENVPYSADTSYGYTTPIHAHYITTLTADTLSGKNINFFFTDQDEFIFMNGSGSSGLTGEGFMATNLSLIVQIDYTGGTTPKTDGWKKFDVTDQINNHVIGQPINPENLINGITVFLLKPSDYPSLPDYNLDYLDYPLDIVADENKLIFGEEAFFYGNVRTEISSSIFQANIPVILELDEFNSTTNPTWNSESDVYICEVGLYDEDGNLLAIAKLNNPINKNENIARTIVVTLDW